MADQAKALDATNSPTVNGKTLVHPSSEEQGRQGFGLAAASDQPDTPGAEERTRTGATPVVWVKTPADYCPAATIRCRQPRPATYT